MGHSSSASHARDKLNCTLDDALERVILALESDQPLERESLLADYPQWADQLNEFIDNWLAMEHRTARLPEVGLEHDDGSMENLNGRIVGDYELLQLISTGGMGVVYRARQISLGRIVALKMVLNTVRDKARFRIEAEAAAALHHANIVAIHEVGEFEGQPFLSMQYIAGGNLQDHLKAGPMAPKAAAGLVRTIAMAVHYAHQRGILHRDLKPANVLLDAERRPYVSDFGLAKQIGNSVELTRSGAIIGTPGYMAPEQAMGQVKSITVAADVYGLGAILYATLTGEAPFKTDSDLLTLRKVIEEPPVSPRAMRSDLDRNLETICLKCLEKTPASRYGSARQLVDDLTRYMRGEPVSARPIGFFERRWRWCLRNPTMACISFFAGLLLTCVILLSLGIAWREYAADMNAKFASIREAAMAEAVEIARVDAESQSRAALEAISDLYTTNGLWAARTDLLGESLLWFSQAARLSGIAESHAIDSRTRCLSWLSQSPKPVAALQLPAAISSGSFQTDWRNWQLSTTLPEIMFKSGGDFGIWNFRSDEIWQPTGKDFKVNTASWSKDGKLLAIGSVSGELRMLDAATKAGQAVAHLGGPITGIALSSSGNLTIVCLSHKVVILRSHDLQPQREWEMQFPCWCMRFSNDDSKVAIVTRNGKVTVYSITGSEPQMLLQTDCFLSKRSPYAQIFVPEFSADGSQLLVQTEEIRFRILDTTTGKQLGPTVVTGSTHCMAVSANQAHCASGGDGYARVQSIKWANGAPSFVRHDCRLAHDDAVTNVAFGGQLIATAGRDRVVQLWSIGEEKRPGGLLNEPAIPLASLVHTNGIIGLLFDASGRQLVTVQSDGLMRVWQIPSFEPPGYVTHATQGGSTTKIVGMDRWLMAGSTFDGSNVVNASLRRVKDGLVTAETPLNGLNERGHLLDAEITGDQSKLISLHARRGQTSEAEADEYESGGSIQVWDFPDGRPFGSPISVAAEPRSVVLHQDQKIAAVLLANAQILLVDIEQPSVVATLHSQESEAPSPNSEEGKPNRLRNGQLLFSADGQLLIAWGLGNGFTVWNWKEGKQRFTTAFAKDWTVYHLAHSTLAGQLAVADHRTNRFSLLNDSTGEVIREVDHLARIRSLEYSPDGKHILASCDDGRARIFDALRPESRSIDLVHNKQVLDACFAPDGLSVATLTSEMRVYLWRLRDRQWAMRPMPVPKETRELQFSPDSQYMVTMGLGPEIKVLNLSSFNNAANLDLDYVNSLGVLLSSKAIENGSLVNLTTAEWLERWQAFRAADVR